jgi:hypothetical protein
MVDGEGALEPVGGDVPGRPVPADVVDQQMDSRKGLSYLLSQVSYFRFARRVCDE